MKKSKHFELLQKGQRLQPYKGAFFIMDESDLNMTFEKAFEKLSLLLSTPGQAENFYKAMSIIIS